MITRDTITRIMDAVRIEEVVGDFITLKRRGANMLGNCPFHNEKSPSFTVSPAKGIYKCFGCGVSGNSVNFIMEHEHVTYPESLRYLAKKYNIALEETESPGEEEVKERNLQESLYIANSFAQKYYSDKLHNTVEGQSVGLSYFKERGFKNDTIDKFQLGYALDSHDAMTKTALAEGYQLDVLKRAGLTSDKYERPLDFFRDRVMFTIHNFSGKVVGFGGRTLKSDKKIPKYVNTSETEIYNKSKILYGLFFAKNAVRRQDECIMVEGYTDVISMSQAGVENVVSSSGTSLTVEQIRLIRRLTPNITIIYDGDAAGIKAALRGIDLVLEEDMNVRVVLLPPEHDPDSFIKANGAAAFTDYKVKNQEDFILFKTRYLLKDVQHDPVKKTEAIKDIIHSISLVPDTIKRTLYVTECSGLLNMDERILITEINKQRKTKFSKDNNVPAETLEPIITQGQGDTPTQREPERTEKVTLARQEIELIRLLLEYGNDDYPEEEGVKTAAIILREMEAGPDVHFEDPAADKILHEFWDAVTLDRPIPDYKYFTDQQDEGPRQLAIDLAAASPTDNISDNWVEMHNVMMTPRHIIMKRDLTSTITRYKLIQVNMLSEQNKADIKALQGDEAYEKMMPLLQKQMRLDEARMMLGKVLGTVITK